jgi:phage tail-like protein
MPTRREFDPLEGATFAVEIEGVTTGAFESVDFIESSSDIVTFRNGDDALERKRPGRARYANIVMRRAYTNNDELHDWRKAVEDGRVERKAGSIIVLDGSAQRSGEICRFNFFEGWPCRWRLGTWDANDAEVLFEEIEIVVEKIEKG